jgi:hypothetical protein
MVCSDLWSSKIQRYNLFKTWPIQSLRPFDPYIHIGTAAITTPLGAIELLNKVRPESGLPDFSRYKIPKWGKYTKVSLNIPNGNKIYQMAAKYTKWA